MVLPWYRYISGHGILYMYPWQPVSFYMKSPGVLFLFFPLKSVFFSGKTQCTGLRPAVKTFNLLPRKFLFSCVFFPLAISGSFWRCWCRLFRAEQSKDQRTPKGAMMKGGEGGKGKQRFKRGYPLSEENRTELTSIHAGRWKFRRTSLAP